MASTGGSGPSLEPYLRARALNPQLIPSARPRTARYREPSSNSTIYADDFSTFLKRLIGVCLTPITLPFRLLHQAATSPLTISLLLKLILLAFLTLASAVFSVLAVGAFWYSWGTGGAIETAGWLFYGSTSHRTPHTLIQLPVDRFQEDLKYDVQLEMELVRPTRGAEEMGNFMLSLDLRSQRNQELTLVTAAQPSLPPPPLPVALLPLPSLPFNIPCFVPWPFRAFCPSRLLGYDAPRERRNAARRARSAWGSPVTAKEVVLLTKELMDGVVMKPGRGGDAVVGSAFVSIGREDSFHHGTPENTCNTPREIRTTGWVVVRFIPRPTGIRWILSSHPIPPLLILPGISLSLTLSSAIIAFLIITYFSRSSSATAATSRKRGGGMDEQSLLAERKKNAFEAHDRDTARDAERRKKEWEEVESAATGLRKMPEERKRGTSGISSMVGGSETTAPSQMSGLQSLNPIMSDSEDAISETTAPPTDTETEMETATEGGSRGHGRSGSDGSDGWNTAH